MKSKHLIPLCFSFLVNKLQEYLIIIAWPKNEQQQMKKNSLIEDLYRITHITRGFPLCLFEKKE